MSVVLEIASIIASSLGLIAVFFVFEALTRRYAWSPEEMRRVAHVLGTFFGIAVGIYFSSIIFIVVTILFALLMAFSHRKRIFSHIHGVSRKTFGEELLPLGLLGAYLISNANPHVFVPAFLITGIADPLSGFVTHHTYRRFLGFFCFTASAAFLLLVFTPLGFLTACGIALFTGLIEQLSTHGTDNVTVPAALALVLSRIL